MKIVRPLEAQKPIEGQDDVVPRLSAGVYVELVRSLYRTIIPTSIMTACFVAVGLYIVRRTPDDMLSILFALGCLASVVRISVTLAWRGAAASETLDAKTAGRLERRFAPAYFGFALAFGAFCARGFAVAPADARMLLVGLVFGYGAGVATGISLRPWISIPSALAAIVPMIVTGLFMPGVGDRGAGVLTAVFLAGGIQSMLTRYQATSRQISMHRLLSTLGRLDELTRLPNRLLLGERFERLTLSTAAEPDLVAVHMLTVEGLTQVNQSYGYPTGDALLRSLAERLGRILADGDFAARLGGVEFAIVQPGLVQSRQAEILAQQIMIALTAPYAICGRPVSIDVRIGYAYNLQSDADLDILLDGAGQAVRKAAAEGVSIICHNQPKWVEVSKTD